MGFNLKWFARNPHFCLNILLLQFLREELKYESGYEKRHKAFHHNDDLHISVKELWDAWLRSEVSFIIIKKKYLSKFFIHGQVT